MSIVITAFARSPDRGRGLARDMRVRWALEESGQRYGVRGVSFEQMKQPAHLALQPFGQIPSYEEGSVRLFETGAIVLHIAAHHPGLLPADAAGRARATSWLFAAFARSPDRGRGLARDMRVRWALEESGQRYGVRGVSFEQMKQPAHLALQPFGQIPSYEEGSVRLFETGAIVLHIAAHHPGLLPADAAGRARATSWLFAALSTLEPPILERETARREEAQSAWNAARMPLLEQRIHQRLAQLSVALGQGPWLDGEFSAGDLMMISVLVRLKSSSLLEEHPNLGAYLARGEARPAYGRAFEAQRAAYEASLATGD